MYKPQPSVSETPMEKKYRDMVNTRRLYKFEGEFFERSPYRYMHVQMNEQTLVNIGKIIWYDETGSLMNMPEIRFGNGLYHGTTKGTKYYYSWCNRETIELAPTQRDLLTLIHEIIHALGYDYHDSRFVGRYVDMLVKYAGLPKKQLLYGMYEYKVAIPQKYKRLCTPKISKSRRSKKK